MNEWVRLPRPQEFRVYPIDGEPPEFDIEYDEVDRTVVAWFDRLSPTEVRSRTRIERFFLDYYTEEQAAEYVAHMLKKMTLDLATYGLAKGVQVARIKREAYTTMQYLEFRVTGIACDDQAKVITRIEAEDYTNPLILAALMDKDQRVLDAAWDSLKTVEVG